MRQDLTVYTYTYLWVAINLCGKITRCKHAVYMRSIKKHAYIRILTVTNASIAFLSGEEACDMLVPCFFELSWNVHCMKITIECSEMIGASGFVAEIQQDPHHQHPRLPGCRLGHHWKILAKRILAAKAYRVVPQSVDPGSCIQGIHLPKVFEISITSSINSYQIIPWDKKRPRWNPGFV